MSAGPVWGGIKAALEAFVVAFTLLTLLILVALLADGDGMTWALALTGATRFWLLGHGGGVNFGELALNILPLGFAALCLWLIRARAKRADPSWGAVIGGSVMYAFITFAITRIAGAPHITTTQASLGAFILGVTGFLVALAPKLKWYQTALNRCPVSVFAGFKAGGVALLATIGAAAVLAGVWAFFGRDSSRAVAETLQPGIVGSVVVGIGQFLLLPNWLLWITGWLVGPGFSVGTGSEFSPASWQSGPLPALPIVASLPPQSWAGPYWQWVPVFVLLIGALSGLFLWRFLGGRLLGLSTLWIAAGCAVLFSIAGMFSLQWLAEGSLGSGRLSQVGATAWLVAVIFGAEVAAGIAMVLTGKLIGSRPTVVPDAQALSQEIPEFASIKAPIKADASASKSAKKTKAKLGQNLKAPSVPVQIEPKPKSVPVRKSVFTLLDDD